MIAPDQLAAVRRLLAERGRACKPSNRQIAALCGVSAHTVARIEHGKGQKQYRKKVQLYGEHPEGAVRCPPQRCPHCRHMVVLWPCQSWECKREREKTATD